MLRLKVKLHKHTHCEYCFQYGNPKHPMFGFFCCPRDGLGYTSRDPVGTLCCCERLCGSERIVEAKLRGVTWDVASTYERPYKGPTRLV